MFEMKPLLALDWVEIAIVLFIMSSSLIGQLYKAVQNKQKKGQLKKPGRPPIPVERNVPGVGQPIAGAPAAPPKPSLEQEIEAFLRKTLGGEKPKKNKPSPKSAKQQPTRKISRQRPPTVPRQTPPQPSVSQFPASESVGQHVQRHIRSGGVRQRDAHLGEQIGQADERLESHLHDVFEHKLGSLGERSAESVSSIGQGTDAAVWNTMSDSSPIHQQIFQLLSSPQNVQAAVILSEILRRPEELS